MGGQGSGRKPNVFNLLKSQDEAIEFTGGRDTLNLPNYSGIKDSVKKTTSWTTGSVLFADSNGDIGEDNDNFYWDSANNGLKINKLAIGESISGSHKLVVTGSGRISGNFYVSNGKIYTTGGYGLSLDSSGGDYAKIYSNSVGERKVHIMTNGTDRLVIDDNGRFGFGSTSTAYKYYLTTDNYLNPLRYQVVSGTDNGAYVELKSNNGRGQITLGSSSDSANLLNTTGGWQWTTQLNIMNGSVGINTATPDTKLQVVGDTKFGDDNTNYATFKSDGELNLVGSARVKKKVWIGANGIRAPGTKPATFVESGIKGAWEFADAVAGNEEAVSGTIKIPADMDRSVAPTFNIGWSADGSSPGDCEWQFEYLWIGADEDTTAAAQETLTVTSTASATSNGLIVAEISGIDLPASTDKAMFWRITRLSASANDTISDVVLMHGNFFEYTSNKLGEAT